MKRKIKKKKRLYKKAKKQENNKSYWSHFKAYSNNIRKEQQKLQEDYINGLFTPGDEGTGAAEANSEAQRKSTCKNLWSYLRSKKSDDVRIPPLQDEKGKVVSGSKEEQTEGMPTPEGPKLPTMSYINAMVNGVEKLLKKLNPKKAQGPDLIPVRIMKECAGELAPMLTFIFNQSNNTSQIPKDWLTANVVSIFKKGAKCDPNNYRPISLMAVPCKLYEHIIHHHTMEHAERYNLLFKNQHGFRKAHSTETQLIHTLEDVHHHVHQGKQVDMLILDFTKAFDKIPHKWLLTKLYHYGIRVNNQRWLRHWLTNRTQQVILDGEQSMLNDVTSGLPQGTVLGSLMFLLYI